GERVRQSRVLDVLELARREIRWDSARTPGRGRGVAVEIRHVGGGKTSLRLRLVPATGQVEVLTGMVDQGAGAHTVIRRVAAAAARLGNGAPVEVDGTYAEQPHGHDEGGDFNASVYAVEVEVDRETGAVRVCDAVQVVDIGTVINPLAHQGQLNGGFAFGIGAALMEELPVDRGGKVTALSLGEYKLPTVVDMPHLRTVLLRTEIGPGPFGAKAV